MWKNVYLKINVYVKNIKRETEDAGKKQEPVILDRESRRVSLTSRNHVTLCKRNPVRRRSKNKNRAVHTHVAQGRRRKKTVKPKDSGREGEHK